MGAIIDTLRNLGPVRLGVIGAILIGMIGFFIYLITRFNAPQMTLLYGDLAQQDAAQIVRELESSSIPYEIGGNGAQIFVSGDNVLRTRMTMAELGLPAGGSVGYELFDNVDALGSTNFVQNVNLLRALEGELARTIGTIENIKMARVHLVMPRRELFSRERQKPTASVVLRMINSKRLDNEQVAAIQHLVATAVPDLATNSISIVDEKGNLLASGGDVGQTAMFEQDAVQKRISYESRLARTLEELLEKTVGFGKVRAEVRAEMDFDRISSTQEIFDPDGQVVRSTQTVEEQSNQNDNQQDLPTTVTVNLPDPTQGTAGISSTANQSRNEETVNYEITKTVRNTVREAGVVNRLSVAVLVDGIYNTDGEGKAEYLPRQQEEMEKLVTLVRTAIGYNADRGDSVEVINMQFADVITEEVEVPELFFGLQKDDLMKMAEILVLSIVFILALLLVVRPLVSRAFESLPGTLSSDEQTLLADGTAVGAGMAALPGSSAMSAMEGPPSDRNAIDELIDIDRVEGQVKASSVKKIGEIVEKHPDETLSILRNWMFQEA